MAFSSRACDSPHAATAETQQEGGARPRGWTHATSDSSALPKPSSFAFKNPMDAWRSGRDLLAEHRKTSSGGGEENPMHKKIAGERHAARDAKLPKTPSDLTEHVPLPGGWFEATDGDTGKTYFYTATGDVSWIRPTTSIVHGVIHGVIQPIDHRLKRWR